MEQHLHQKEKSRIRFVSFTLSSLFILLVSCSESSGPRYIDSDLVPPSPPFWKYFTVAGADDDLDGVRDDVELWINEEFEDPNIRKALKWNARVIYNQMFMATPDEAVRLEEESREAEDCLRAVSIYKSKDKEWRYLEGMYYPLKDKMINSFWREIQRNKAAKNVPRGSYLVSLGNIVKMLNECTFKIVNQKRILEYAYESGRYKRNASEDEREDFLKLLKETE